MAALWRSIRHTRRYRGTFCKYLEFRRCLLSDNYRCQEEWQKYLNSPTLTQVEFGYLSYQMYTKFDNQGFSSLIDMDILANKIQTMHEQDHEYMQRIIKMFRRSKDAFPVRDSIVHGIIRNYLEKGMDKEILEMIQDRKTFGLFPDSYTANLLMDHFIKLEQFPEAAKVAYELMFQEDFSGRINFLLALYTCTKHLTHTATMDAHSKEEEDVQEEEDEDDDDDNVEWVAKKVVQAPHYDDHFDIQCEQYKLGKTMYMLGCVQGDNLLGRSVKLTGLALYDKFARALSLLKQWKETGEKEVVMKEAVDRLGELLNETATRDPDAPEKEYAMRTLKDDILKHNLTPEEKEKYTKELQVLSAELESNGQLSSHSLITEVETFVTGQLKNSEKADMDSYVKHLNLWEKERQEMFDQQVEDYLRNEKIEEIAQKLAELQEKEETLRFFENKQQIKRAYIKAPWEKEEEREMTLDELEEKERNKKNRKSVLYKRRR
ncbi:28S ribosomal protein S27, mitochondrial-like [Pecten maximus]|uniref:28S ribosomal protein S27, mitochondrial-like n=1 Tax=Pecten maximus TaxID=6579 RepID=UPI001458C7DC|nr:28S ribosomal protein S27, mitochondrial-like [Pecten maximus]